MSSPALSSAALVRAARRRDPVAWKQLVERYDGMIRDICRAYRLAGADVDDVRQTVWLRAVEHLDRLQNPQGIGSWLATVTRNECLRLLQHASRVRPCEEEVLHLLPDTREAPDERLLRGVVRGAIAALPSRDQRLLGLLYHPSEPSYSDISRVLEMPVGSIGPTRGRVLGRLRSQAGIADLAAAA
jgi:RNA polymerase sigma factor (sigma-70 family)